MGGNRGAKGWLKLISFLALSGPQPDSCKSEHKVLWHMFALYGKKHHGELRFKESKSPFCPLNWTGKPSDRLHSVIAALELSLNHCLLLCLFRWTLGIWDKNENRENKTLLETTNSPQCLGARCSSWLQTVCSSSLTCTHSSGQQGGTLGFRLKYSCRSKCVFRKMSLHYCIYAYFLINNCTHVLVKTIHKLSHCMHAIIYPPNAYSFASGKNGPWFSSVMCSGEKKAVSETGCNAQPAYSMPALRNWMIWFVPQRKISGLEAVQQAQSTVNKCCAVITVLVEAHGFSREALTAL